MTNLGAQLRAARESKGLTQESVARLANVTTNTVARVERGPHQPRMATLLAIAAALEVNVADLFEQSA